MVGEIEGAALEVLAVTEQWFRNDRLKQNTDKTQIMVYVLGRSHQAANPNTQKSKLCGWHEKLVKSSNMKLT